MCELKGIDVSDWQGEIKWGVVKDHIDFAIIRAGYGQNNIDSMASINAIGCRTNNIPFGFYWFSYAYTVDMAIKEANHFINFVKDYAPRYPLYFDFEYDSYDYARRNGVTVTRELLNEMATAFCETLEKNGYYAGIYANCDYIVNHYGEGIFNKFDLWYADWTKANTSPRKTNLWQYSSTGFVEGVDTKVDLNIAYVDFPKLMVERGLNKLTPPTFKCPHGCPHCPHSGGNL